jgi:hypothetical protein
MSSKKTDVHHSIRLSQTIAPFGVGAILDILGESLIACDLAHWGPAGEPLHLDRLERALGKAGFRSAPSTSGFAAGKGKGVPYVRFPRWLFCPNSKCRTMKRWRRNDEIEGEPARCTHCDKQPQLVPMRFVAVCEKGHMDDVPWQAWAHSTSKEPKQLQCHSLNLALLSRGQSAGLDALLVHCRTCGAQRSLAGISKEGSLQDLPSRFADEVRCVGTQPWQSRDSARGCGAPLQVLQRGATNVYFASSTSALDIPPSSDYDPFSELSLAIQSHPNFTALTAAPNGPAAPFLIDAIAQSLGCEVSVVRGVLDALSDVRVESDEGDDLLTGEWNAFTEPDRDFDPRSRFIKISTPLVNPALPAPDAVRQLASQIETVALATRLREVRALVSFGRYKPTSDEVPVDLYRGLDWLPAIEVYGEGIFIGFNEAAVQAWERAEVAASNVAAILEPRRQKSLMAARLPQATSRYVMLHTFAHLLIRQLVFECGYSAASLRERIYSRTPKQGDPYAGILIYTSAGDVEGTLGGLVRQGKAPRLASSILKALERGSWCSSDPLCRENPGQGFASLNLAACHACCLLPETSCETGNRLLDRSLVIGNDHRGAPGFLESALNAALGVVPK